MTKTQSIELPPVPYWSKLVSFPLMEDQMGEAVQGSLTDVVNNAGLAPPARKVVLASAFGTIIEWYELLICLSRSKV